MFENFGNHRCLDIVVVTVVTLVFVFVQNPRRMGSVTSQSREPGMTGAAGISNCDRSRGTWRNPSSPRRLEATEQEKCPGELHDSVELFTAERDYQENKAIRDHLQPFQILLDLVEPRGTIKLHRCSRLWWKETRESVRVFGGDLQAASEIRQI